jgi:hypothetical protein
VSRRTIALLFSLLAGVPSLLPAQTVTVIGGAEQPAIVLLNQILARGQFMLVDRDTVFGPEFVWPNDLVLVDARLALEGRIDGAVAVIGGDFFVRPRAAVAGPIAVIEGGAFVSGFATAGERIELDPRVSVSVERQPQGYTLSILVPPDPPPLRFPGLAGFGAPTHDRVNGLSLIWGSRLGAGEDPRVSLSGTVAVRTARRRLDGSLQLTARPSERTSVALQASSGSRTNDAWIRGDLANSLASFFLRSDVRDYFHSNELAVTAAVEPTAMLGRGDAFIAPRARLRVSRDRSLESADPWTVLDRRRAWRPNPPIDEGVLASVVGGATSGWRGGSSTFSGGAALEWGLPQLGDFAFAQLTASLNWWMEALWDHELSVQGHLLHPIGDDAAPRQRWSHVGGPGTLPVHPVAVMRGDHLIFVRSVYLAPIPRVRLPVVGQPTLRLEHAAGAAWVTGTPRPLLEQNAGAGLQVLIFNAMLMVDPTARPFPPRLFLGAEIPGSGPVLVF